MNFIVNHIIPKAMSIEEVESESAKDSTLQYVREAVQTGKWYENIQKDDKVKSYHRVKNDLTVSGNLVLFVDMQNHYPREAAIQSDKYCS